MEPTDWVLARRRAVAEAFARSVPGASSVFASPSGRYRLRITDHATGPHTGECARGTVSRAADGGRIAQVDRNDGFFPFAWIEGHPSGHDDLLCGEDYQGQTVVELDTGARVDNLPAEARAGTAFCWAALHPSPDGTLLFVEGCHWACPYELVLYDLSQPMALPYRELRRWPVEEVRGFQPDGSFVFELLEAVRRSDGRPLREPTAEEEDALDASPSRDTVVRDRRCRVRWHPTEAETCTPVD